MGLFCVTVVTAERARSLSRIADGAVRIGPAGEVVAGECVQTGRVRPGVTLDAFVVMPDHVHLIIGQFKGACARRIQANVDPAFAWQARLYDLVERHLEQARRYVEENPARWNTR